MEEEEEEGLTSIRDGSFVYILVLSGGCGGEGSGKSFNSFGINYPPMTS